MISTGPLLVWRVCERHSITPRAANTSNMTAAAQPLQCEVRGAPSSSSSGSAAMYGASLKPRNDGPTMVAVPELGAGPDKVVGLFSFAGAPLTSRKRGLWIFSSAGLSGSSPRRLTTLSAAGTMIARPGGFGIGGGALGSATDFTGASTGADASDTIVLPTTGGLTTGGAIGSGAAGASGSTTGGAASP